MAGAYLFLKEKETFNSVEFTCGQLSQTKEVRYISSDCPKRLAELFIRRQGDSKLFH